MEFDRLLIAVIGNLVEWNRWEPGLARLLQEGFNGLEALPFRDGFQVLLDSRRQRWNLPCLGRFAFHANERRFRRKLQRSEDCLPGLAQGGPDFFGGERWKGCAQVGFG